MENGWQCQTHAIGEWEGYAYGATERRSLVASAGRPSRRGPPLDELRPSKGEAVITHRVPSTLAWDDRVPIDRSFVSEREKPAEKYGFLKVTGECLSFATSWA